MLFKKMRKSTVIGLVLVMGLLLQCMPLIATTSADGNPVSVEPVAEWSFDEGEGTIAADTSENGFDGAVSGATWVTGKVGSALSFDGNDYVEVPHYDALNPGTVLAVEAWIKPTAAMQDWQKIICKSTLANTDYSIFCRKDNRIGFSIKMGKVAQTAYSLPDSVKVGAWTHVVGTYDGAKISLYINGKLVKSFAVTGKINDNQGVLRIGGDTVNANFKGVVDEVNIYQQALSAAEVLSRYEAGNNEVEDPQDPQEPQDPVINAAAKWSFDEGEGTIAADASENAFDGVVLGATWVTGKVGSALSFDGNDFVEVPYYDALGALNPGTALTVEAWIKPTAAMQDWQKIICKSLSTKTDYSIICRKDNRIGFSIKMGKVAQTAYSLPDSVKVGVWTHVVGTYDGAKMSLYLNGKLVNSFAVTGRINDNYGVLRIGGDTINANFKGLIDEVSIYDRALTANQILNNYKAGN